MQQPQRIKWPNTFPHEYSEELLDQPVPLYSTCEYSCDQGWLMLPDETSIPCFHCNPDGRVECGNCGSLVEDRLHCPECDSVEDDGLR